MMNKTHDVVIVGAGPVGSYTAYLLAKAGLDVGIFEKNPVIGRDINCSGIISVECFQKLKLPADVILRQVDSIKAIAPSGDSMRYRAEKPLAYIVNRSLFDQEINRMAVEAGAALYLKSKADKITINGDAFKLKIKTDDGERMFSSKVGIIATGFELNSLYRPSRLRSNFFYGIQTVAEMENLTDVEVYFGEKIAPGSFGWVVPTNGASAKIGLLVKNDPAEYLKKFTHHPFIAQRLKSKISPIRCSPVPDSAIEKSYSQRLVIVGEAAGQVKATTGGGIYFGLLCAEFAVQTILDATASGDYSERTFRAYETAWRKKLEPELKAGAMLRTIYSKLSDRHIDYLMDLAKRDGVLPLIQKADFDWHKDLVSHLISHLITKKLLRK